MAFDLDDEENKATRKMNGASKESRDKNMDIEVGEYVRTKDGKIDKVINSNFYMGIYVECEKGLYLIKSMVKHSKELIDLVEVRRFCKWISYIRTNIQWKYYVRN